MMLGRLLLDADAAVIERMRPLFPDGLSATYRACVGLVANGRIAGGCLFFGLKPGVEIYGCIGVDDPRALTRGTLQQLAEFAFASFGVKRITAETAKSNKRTRKALERAGFKLEGMKRAGMPNGEPAMIYGLLQGEFAYGRSVSS